VHARREAGLPDQSSKASRPGCTAGQSSWLTGASCRASSSTRPPPSRTPRSPRWAAGESTSARRRPSRNLRALPRERVGSGPGRPVEGFAQAGQPRGTSSGRRLQRRNGTIPVNPANRIHAAHAGCSRGPYRSTNPRRRSSSGSRRSRRSRAVARVHSEQLLFVATRGVFRSASAWHHSSSWSGCRWAKRRRHGGARQQRVSDGA
jgi:hypothetical protein